MKLRQLKGVALLCCMIHSTALGAVASAAPANASHSASYSNKELFQGIALGSGRVARAIPEIHEYLSVDSKPLSAKSKKQVESIHLQLLANIEQNEPEALESFARAVRSADHFQIDSAMTAALQVITRAQTRLAKADVARSDTTAITGNPVTSELLSSKDGTCASVFVAVDVVFAVAVLAASALGVVNYVIAAQVAAIYSAAWVIEPEYNFANQSSLLRDELVDSVARLSAHQLALNP